MKIIQIDGIKGLVSVLFMGVCMFAGFVLFPGHVAMTLWNKYLAAGYMFPVLNLFQGVLLWGIAVITYVILSGKGLAVSFLETPELRDEELEEIINTAKNNPKIHIINKMMANAEKIELPKQGDFKDEKSLMTPSISSITSVSTESKEEETISKVK